MAGAPDLDSILGAFSEAFDLIQAGHMAQKDAHHAGPPEVALRKGIAEMNRVYNDLDRATIELARCCRKQTKVGRAVMSADPVLRLVAAFGAVLVRSRSKRYWTPDALANASGLSPREIRSMEAGDYGPSLMEFFRIAEALGEQPTMLLVDVGSALRADPIDPLHRSPPSDLARLFRLGYQRTPEDFQEWPTAYYSVAESTRAAGRLNAERHTRGVALLDTATVYVRLDSMSLRSDSDQGAS